MQLNQAERILVVENDPQIGDLIANQALAAAGYQVEWVQNTGMAIKTAITFKPDVIIANLQQPGLSGKDLMIALTSQKVDTPVVVLAQKGMESDVIQAYRLGASDYLLWPIREAEVITVIDRVLKQSRMQLIGEQQAVRLETVKFHLKERTREIATLQKISKTLLNINDPGVIYESFLENLLAVFDADLAWLMLENHNPNDFILAAQKNLPETYRSRISQVWDDGISPLVSKSGEILSLSGDSLSRFQISSLGNTALAVPIKIGKQVAGTFILMRGSSEPFSNQEKSFAQLAADIFALALKGKEIEQASKAVKNSLSSIHDQYHFREKSIETINKHKQSAVLSTLNQISTLSENLTQFSENPEIINTANSIADQLENIRGILNTNLEVLSDNNKTESNLVSKLRNSIKKYELLARDGQNLVVSRLPTGPTFVKLDSSLTTYICDSILSKALLMSEPGDRINLNLGETNQDSILLKIKSTVVISNEQVSHIFDEQENNIGFTNPEPNFTIPLFLVKEIVLNQGGKIWVESKPKSGTTFFLVLPLSQLVRSNSGSRI